MRIAQIADVLEEIAPRWYASEGDNVGLQVGDPDREARCALLALDVTPDVLAEAKALAAELIVSHHPLIFKPISSITTADQSPRLLLELIRCGIALYVAHTNLDAAADGTSATLASLLGLERTEPLLPIRPADRVKVVVFVPEAHVDKVRAAMCESGAGEIGEYKYCTFRAKGTGSFLAGQAAKPTIGARGKLEEVEESRLETLVDSGRVEAIVQAIRNSHPYEEPAFDIYPLITSGMKIGIGRIGVLSRPVKGTQLAEQVKDKLGLSQVRTIGDLDAGVARVAVCSGSGKSVLDAVIAKRADMFVAGDIDYHSASKALRAGLPIIDPGHDATEKPGLNRLAERLRGIMPEIHFALSQRPTSPFGML